MGLIKINHNPSRIQLSVFGVAWLVFFATITAVVWSRGGSQRAVAGIAASAVIVPLVGWALPRFMRIVYLAMAYLAFPIGLVVSHSILAITYYLVLTPTGLLMRLIGYDPMSRSFDSDVESYWVPRGKDESVDRYFRQV